MVQSRFLGPDCGPRNDKHWPVAAHLRLFPNRTEAGLLAEWLEVAGNSPYYETNPIVRQTRREAVLPLIFHGLALPPTGEARAGAGFHGDKKSSRDRDPSAGGAVAE